MREPVSEPLPTENNMETKQREVREMARKLYMALILDVWPSPSTCMDFGIASQAHLGALQFAVREDDVTEEQLDAALGKGAEIQKLISPENPYRGVVFHTVWDDLPKRPEES